MNFKFIGANKALKPNSNSTSLLLRRTFNIDKKGKSYLLHVIGLGIAIYHLNNKKITENVLLTPITDYSKTLLFDTYDVTSLIQEGKNVLAIELGNGFYNESLKTVWNIDKAQWRGEKCLSLILECDGNVVLESDESFKCLYSPALLYNELRAGEVVDFRNVLDFGNVGFDDSNFLNASYLEKQLNAKLLNNTLPPIKEFKKYAPIKKISSKNGIIFDFGVNISGYIECVFNERSGKKITFKHAEDIKDNELELHGLDCYQNGEPFQQDVVVANGHKCTYKPKFTYHGFRYVEVSGISNFNDFEIFAISVHEDIKQIKDFPVFKDEIKSKLFNDGINSILSNAFYGFTDCPTREKLFWLNDLQASLPFIMEYFDVKELLKKIMQDIVDAQKEDGNVAGIAPSPNWGYEFGPVCGFAIAKIPYLFYKKYKDISLLVAYKNQIYKYYEFLKNNDDFVLGDWTGNTNHKNTSKYFIKNAYLYLLDQILIEVFDDIGKKEDLLDRKEKLLSVELKGQTIPSFLIVNKLGNIKDNEKCLLKDIAQNDYHLDAGMFGVQYIYEALSILNRKDIIDKIVLNKKAPSFRSWIEEGATSLYENFDETHSLSMNHHMFSNVIKYL